MKIIKRISCDIVIFGTDNNAAEVVIDGSDVSIDGVKIHGLTDYEVVENNNVFLSSPFFVGYQTYIGDSFEFTPAYLTWNTSIKGCIGSVRDEYLAKSNSDLYPAEERAEFLVYADSLVPFIETQYLGPEFTFPKPPDEDIFWEPECAFE